MSSIPDSTYTILGKPQNPFRSRSTVICLACLVTLMVIDGLILKAGYFNAEVGAMSFMVLREIVSTVVGHQLKADAATSKAP